MKQLLVQSDLTSQTIEIDESTRHRLRRVLRLRSGAEVTLADGLGNKRLCRWGGREFEPLGPLVFTPSAKPQVVLAAALLKGPRWSIALEKATEVGADTIVPLMTAHSVVQVPASKADAKREKWQATVNEAFEQCGRRHLPHVELPTTLPQLLRSLGPDTLLFGDEGGSVALDEAAVPQTSDRIVLVVGPEGGLSVAEQQELRDSGAIGVRLGPYVLRAETAAIVGVAAIASSLRRRANADLSGI